MLWRKKTISRGQGRVLDVDEDGKSEITFACFCSLLTLDTLRAAVEELLINIPMVCPLLEEPIAWTREQRGGKQYHPFSPSIDRIRNDLGYVRGNVWIISHKANAMKHSGSAEDLAKIARNLAKKTAGLMH
jgi:hypothetical protein